jgi:hypothetical protein
VTRSHAALAPGLVELVVSAAVAGHDEVPLIGAQPWIPIVAGRVEDGLRGQRSKGRGQRGTHRNIDVAEPIAGRSIGAEPERAEPLFRFVPLAPRCFRRVWQPRGSGEVYRLIVAALAERTPPNSIEIGSYFEVKLASVVRDVEGKKKLVTRDDILGGETVCVPRPDACRSTLASSPSWSRTPHTRSRSTPEAFKA